MLVQCYAFHSDFAIPNQQNHQENCKSMSRVMSGTILYLIENCSIFSISRRDIALLSSHHTFHWLIEFWWDSDNVMIRWVDTCSDLHILLLRNSLDVFNCFKIIIFTPDNPGTNIHFPLKMAIITRTIYNVKDKNKYVRILFSFHKTYHKTFLKNLQYLHTRPLVQAIELFLSTSISHQYYLPSFPPR